VASLIYKFGKTFGLTNPAGDYSNNIKRFKKLIEQATAGVDSMTTATRLAWWNTHTVPAAGITFYSVNASMADPDAGDAEKAFMANHATFSPGSPDDQFLINGYRGMVKASGGVTLNDSQMVPGKSRFWAALAPLLNPAQAPLHAEWLGLLGTHHWGLALQVVSKPTDGALNPYPRVALLEAVAAEVNRGLGSAPAN
jgi:hypothetical protein